MDDVLDLPWRVKLVMPVVASLPLVAAYSGATAVALPKPLIATFDLPYTYVELGGLYYVYMVALVIFCTNSINILAGVNGLEAGQTFLVGGAILAHNVLQLTRTTGALSLRLLACALCSAGSAACRTWGLRRCEQSMRYSLTLRSTCLPHA